MLLACAAARGCLLRKADIPGDCEALSFHSHTPLSASLRPRFPPSAVLSGAPVTDLSGAA